MQDRIDGRPILRGLARLTRQQRSILAELARWRADELRNLLSDPQADEILRAKIRQSVGVLVDAADILDDKSE